MIIGLPKEIKNNENRVALTPAGVKELVERGHSVYVQTSAGAGSGFPDEEYAAAGAQMLPAIEDVYAKEQGEFEVAFAIAAILMILTFVINLAASVVGKYLKKRRYA